MLIGVRLSDLGRRSRWLLAIASWIVPGRAGRDLLFPQSPLWMLRVAADRSCSSAAAGVVPAGRPARPPGRVATALASLFGVLAWLLVLAMLLLWPRCSAAALMAGSALPRIAVLTSGRGSNLLAILDAVANGTLDAEVAGVFSDKPGCGMPCAMPDASRWSRDASAYPDRADFDAELADAVAASHPDWIVCAGYCASSARASSLRRAPGQHPPSLLPRHRGAAHHAPRDRGRRRRARRQRALRRAELDAGAVVAQAVVPVRAGESAGLTSPHGCSPRASAAAGDAAAGGGQPDRGVAMAAWLDGHPLFKPLPSIVRRRFSGERANHDAPQTFSAPSCSWRPWLCRSAPSPLEPPQQLLPASEAPPAPAGVAAVRGPVPGVRPWSFAQHPRPCRWSPSTAGAGAWT